MAAHSASNSAFSLVVSSMSGGEWKRHRRYMSFTKENSCITVMVLHGLGHGGRNQWYRISSSNRNVAAVAFSLPSFSWPGPVIRTVPRMAHQTLKEAVARRRLRSFHQGTKTCDPSQCHRRIVGLGLAGSSMHRPRAYGLLDSHRHICLQTEAADSSSQDPASRFAVRSVQPGMAAVPERALASLDLRRHWLSHKIWARSGV